MAENNHFYLEIRYSSHAAVLLVTEEGEWRLIRSDPGFQFEKWIKQRGTFAPSASGHFFYGGGVGEPDFYMNGIAFPPAIRLTPDFFRNHFTIYNPAWAKALGYASTQDAARANLAGAWYPLATGALISWIKHYCEEKTAEMRQLALSLGLNIAAIFDPTGGLSLAAAIEASTRGDYLGCALNLVGAIPILGKAAQAARSSRMAARLEQLIGEMHVLTDWLKTSKTSLQRAGVQAVGLEGKLVRSAGGAGESILVNRGWIRALDPKQWELVGILPEEAHALGRLAKQGYYVVIRACNPERVKWLQWAAQAGVRCLSKPLWIKAKSLKKGAFAGLVGFRRETALQHAMQGRWMKKVAPPAGFNPGFLNRSGKQLDQVWQIEAHGRDGFQIAKNAPGEFYLAESDGYLVLVDKMGSPYISDLDIAIVQRRMGSGAYAPPGMNVFGHAKAGTGGDNAAYQATWDNVFQGCSYPPGYHAIQHGELTGTAGNFKPAKSTYDWALETRQPVWSPGDTWDSEQLVVAASAQSLDGGVGVANSWEALSQFHRANPMGEMRITR